MKIEHERIFFLLIVVQRNEEPVRQSLTPRALEDFRRQDLFTLLDRPQLLWKKQREQYQDEDRDYFDMALRQSGPP